MEHKKISIPKPLVIEFARIMLKRKNLGLRSTSEAVTHIIRDFIKKEEQNAKSN